MEESNRTRVALAIGCPAGIAPELTARMLVDESVTSACDVIVIGDRGIIEKGAEVAGVKLALDFVRAGDKLPEKPVRPVFVDLGNADAAKIPVGTISAEAGRSALDNFRYAVELAKKGEVDAVTFSPFNKAANRLAYPPYEDEGVFLTEMLGIQGAGSEFNILPKLWNARVTSHVPISGVARLITVDNVLRSLRLTDRTMRASGFNPPRIAVAGLNPHAGDNGNFGREEIDVITPAISAGQKEGIVCQGPVPSDTVFVRARKGEFDAVLTMYHDQGQIAMKLIGFEEGVTLLGGFPFPVLTAAHGSAYDIAGKGVANPGAMRAAVLLAARMGGGREGQMHAA